MVAMIVTDGIQIVRDLISSRIASGTAANTSAWSHIAIGTGSTTLAATQSGLNTEFDRNAFAAGSQGVQKAGNVVTYEASWNAAEMVSGTSIKEAGVFNASANGSMFNRVVFTPETFNGLKELLIDVEITLTGS